MKKSEKIELRVNYAEKERLASIAERRGLTISDVVRGALAGELGDAPVQIPKWPGMVAIAALGVAILAFLGGAQHESSMSVGKFRTVMTSYTLQAVDKHENVVLGPKILSTQVGHVDGFRQTYHFKSEKVSYQLTQVVSEQSDGIYNLTSSVCVMAGSECEEIDSASLILSSPYTLTEYGELFLYGPDGPIFKVNTVTPKLIIPNFKALES